MQGAKFGNVKLIIRQKIDFKITKKVKMAQHPP